MPRWKRRAKWEEVEVEWYDTLQYAITITAVNIEYNLIAALYFQIDLSHKSIRRSVYYVVTYALIASGISSYCYHSGMSYERFAMCDSVFFVFEGACYFWLLVQSMVVSRSTFLIFATYSLLWRLLIIPSSIGSRNGYQELYFVWVAFRSLSFSPCLYWTLWSETQYWRGNSAKSLQTMNLRYLRLNESVISNDLPELLRDNALIDFAFLTVESLLDEGGHSRVYKGHLRQRTVAIKLFTPPEMDSKAMQRFIDETRIATKVRHPHIVELIGIAVRPPDICMVIEYCERGSLFKVLGNEVLDGARKTSFMIQAASALAYLHSLTPPIIHRDVKSHNYLVTQNWMLKLADFGESRIVDSQMTGYIGSHAYMSPEIITSTDYNTKADVYSLGIVLWEILTQQRPYDGIKQMSVLRNVVTGRLRPPLPSNLVPSLGKLLKTMWASNPDARPNAKEVIKTLQLFRSEKKQDEAEMLVDGRIKSFGSTLDVFSVQDSNHSPPADEGAGLASSHEEMEFGSAAAPRAGNPLQSEVGDEGYDARGQAKGTQDRKSRDELKRGGSSQKGGRWLLQNMLQRELSEVEKQLDHLAVRKMMLSEQLQLQRHQQATAQPLTRSVSIGGYGSLHVDNVSRSHRNSPRAFGTGRRMRATTTDPRSFDLKSDLKVVAEPAGTVGLGLAQHEGFNSPDTVSTASLTPGRHVPSVLNTDPVLFREKRGGQQETSCSTLSYAPIPRRRHTSS
eukprot:CAMPEP_0167775536 /NCGR_PEP_ID=MMETSP0111_2-20121227/2619_1 /TAXON_ID=91324 /ORGANISM="Lotharella globosa, Strain CCCM811" /LENGTH=733 /DNA_ID=CAMNT_0007665473 /DNA_START=177 /DNA_END=2378 /DNA_ORIENTATION=+